MKIGDLIRFKAECVGAWARGTSIILRIGYPDKDLWVLTSDNKEEWWNEKYVEVISESW